MAPNINPLSNSDIASSFTRTLQTNSRINIRDDPNYYAKYPSSLISTSTAHSFTTGTGSSIYRTIASLLSSTNEELILVTCFWARSKSLESLNEVLRDLSCKAIRRGTSKIRVRICFSSLSIFQKLFHNQSLEGQTYPQGTWTKKLGLPNPNELGGLDINIKSVFLLPFSIMHPKFMIVDRAKVILPSCNISWEEWFEGSVTLSGAIVGQFLQFYQDFWERGREMPKLDDYVTSTDAASNDEVVSRESDSSAHTHNSFPSSQPIPSIFLPSPHRRNPCFQPFTRTDRVHAPPTPLNAFILTLCDKAERTIQIQTPNITSPPVLSGLLRALQRGIDVDITTSETLMVLEQLVTAGATTKKCVKKLIKRYEQLSSNGLSRSTTDEEAALPSPPPGKLSVSYYSPLGGAKRRGEENGEPQQSHLKLMIVDDEVLVLGSGNLDRASWFGSQELGVALFDKTIAGRVKNALGEAMSGRRKVVYDNTVI